MADDVEKLVIEIHVAAVAADLLEMLVSEAESSATEERVLSLSEISIDLDGWAEVVRVALAEHGFVYAGGES